jgi:hypothetical protein
LQNTTWPAVTVVLPETTEAVSVTAVPVETLLDETVKVVIVAAACAHTAGTAPRTSTAPNRARIAGKTPEPFIDKYL